MSTMRDTPIRNPEQLGRLIRLKRQEKGLSQVELAKVLGVGRKWLIHLEAGNSRAEIGLILKAFNALKLRAHLTEPRPAEKGPEPSRLEEVFQRLQRPGRK
jgi:transcriptional regulator with XRE-family HTH domain